MLSISSISETFQDFPDNSSLAIIVYFRGCSHHCLGCHNYDLQTKPEQGVDYFEALTEILNSCKRSNTNKIVFSGGDPFYEDNRKDIMKLIAALELQGKEVCVYTGYDLDQVSDFYRIDEREPLGGRINSQTLSYETIYPKHVKPSYLKCGLYIESLKEKKWGKTDEELKLATTNQKFYKREGDGLLFDYKIISKENILEF